MLKRSDVFYMTQILTNIVKFGQMHEDEIWHDPNLYQDEKVSKINQIEETIRRARMVVEHAIDLMDDGVSNDETKRVWRSNIDGWIAIEKLAKFYREEYDD